MPKRKKKPLPKKKYRFHKYIGVTWRHRKQKWESKVITKGQVIILGYFKTDYQAANARDEFIIAYGLSQKIQLEANKGNRPTKNQ